MRACVCARVRVQTIDADTPKTMLTFLPGGGWGCFQVLMDEEYKSAAAGKVVMIILLQGFN